MSDINGHDGGYSLPSDTQSAIALAKTWNAKLEEITAGAARAIVEIVHFDVPECDVRDALLQAAVNNGLDAVLGDSTESVVVLRIEQGFERGRHPDWVDDAPPIELREPKPKPSGERFTPVFADDITLDDEPDYLVQHMVPQGPSLTVIVGRDKSGKSFLACDVLFHVAMGRPYLGCQVKQGTAVYVSNEGPRGIRKRIVAMRRHHGVEGNGVPFCHIKDVVDLGKRASVDELVARLRQTIAGPIAAIAIDPLMNAMPGLSDSESKDVNIVATNLQYLADAFNAAVLIGHHAPRADDHRSRGSNVLDGRADAMWSVVKTETDNITTVTVYRMKDGPDGLTWKFRLDPVDLGPDRNGYPRTSAGIAGIALPSFAGTQANNAGGAQANARRRLTANQQRFVEIAKRAIVDAGSTITDSVLVPIGARVITREMLKKYCVIGGWIEEGDTEAERKRARSAVSEMLNVLAGKHVIGVSKEHVWII